MSVTIPARRGHRLAGVSSAPIRILLLLCDESECRPAGHPRQAVSAAPAPSSTTAVPPRRAWWWSSWRTKWLGKNLCGCRRWARGYDGLLVVTVDEAEHSPTKRIPAHVVGPVVYPGRYVERVDHYRLLGTIEGFYHLPRAGHSQARRPLIDAWQN